MAKRAADKPEKTAKVELFDQGGVGKKQCPACHKYFKGPTRKECPGCGFKFPPSGKKARKGKGGTVDGFAAVNAAVDFVGGGTVEEAKENLAKFESLINAAGDLEGAKQALEQLAAIEKRRER
jgi:hypothetical protein